MENNKGSKILVRILLFIIVVLLLILGIGAGWYLGKNDKSANKETTTNTGNNVEIANNTNNTTNDNIKDNEKNNISNSSSVNSNKEITADEIFAIYSKNVKNEIIESEKKLPKDIEGNLYYNYKEYRPLFNEFPISSSYINGKLEAFLTVNGTEGPIKIADNAINCGVCSSGNGGAMYVIWAIDVNGNLYTTAYDALNTENKMKFDLTKEPDFKNVIDVIQYGEIGGWDPIVVDILGNTTDLYK